MLVPHNAFVLVADGRKSLFFRNDGDAEFPNLVVEDAQEHPNPADRFHKTDAAGRSFGTQMGSKAPNAAKGGGMGGGGEGGAFAPSRGRMEEVDVHNQEEIRFAIELADMLKRRALAHEFEKLIIVAPPATLGYLRKHYHKEVESRLAGEIAKDLTGHTVPDIEKALKNA